MSLLVKICGLSTSETIDAARDAGADLIGLNFHPRSPRHVGLDRARELAARARAGAGRRSEVVALAVDLADEALEAIRRAVEPDLWQFHGNEPPERLTALRASLGRPVMKVFGVAGPDDLAAIGRYKGVADRILIDAKPPAGAAYPGGHGKPFDWAILGAFDPALPLLLSGGLTPDNVADAIRTMRGMGLSLAGVDVSSGVESAPGLKDADKIRAFIAAVRTAAEATADNVKGHPPLEGEGRSEP